MSQSTSSYPIGGSVFASNSLSFPSIFRSLLAQYQKKNELPPAHPHSMPALPLVVLDAYFLFNTSLAHRSGYSRFTALNHSTF
jgi:hypothetical protein